MNKYYVTFTEVLEIEATTPQEAKEKAIAECFEDPLEPKQMRCEIEKVEVFISDIPF